MKHISYQTQKIIIILLLISACLLQSLPLWAQNTEKRSVERRKDGKVRIRIEKEKNGRKQVYERTYDSDEIPDKGKLDFSFPFPDSVQNTLGDLNTDFDWSNEFDSNHRFSFDWFTDSLPERKGFFHFNQSDFDSLLSRKQDTFGNFSFDNNFLYSFQMPDVQPFPFKRDSFSKGFSFDALPSSDRFEFDKDDYELEEQKTRRGRKYIITRKKHSGDQNESEEKRPPSVTNLKVSPGAVGVINLSFYLPSQGDVSIRVTDTQGKEVFSEKLKEAKGSYSRQLNLSRKSGGTYFVTVTQHKDGQVQRVIVR
jgi:hypothetical protein